MHLQKLNQSLWCHYANHIALIGYYRTGCNWYYTIKHTQILPSRCVVHRLSWFKNCTHVYTCHVTVLDRNRILFCHVFQVHLWVWFSSSSTELDSTKGGAHTFFIDAWISDVFMKHHSSSVLQCVELGDAIEIRERIISDFYAGHNPSRKDTLPWGRNVCVLRRGGGLCVLSILPAEWYIHTHVYIHISHVGYTYTHIYHPIGMTHTFIQPSS